MAVSNSYMLMGPEKRVPYLWRTVPWGVKLRHISPSGITLPTVSERAPSKSMLKERNGGKRSSSAGNARLPRDKMTVAFVQRLVLHSSDRSNGKRAAQEPCPTSPHINRVPCTWGRTKKKRPRALWYGTGFLSAMYGIFRRENYSCRKSDKWDAQRVSCSSGEWGQRQM